jgi:predicted Zn-dependent peptidase
VDIVPVPLCFVKQKPLVYNEINMVKPTKTLITGVIFFLFSIPTLHAATQAFTDRFAEYTLQNGMKVYILEDSASVPVRIEYTARAGISAQTPETAGFFPLYARLFTDAGKASYSRKPDDWLPSQADSSCGADSVRCILTVAPSQTETALDQIAHCAFSPVFSDTELQTQFSTLKTEVMNYAFSTAGFINSSIDARIFQDAPWKQDTGVYPALFTNTPLAQARTILSNIARTYYIPQNSALFISGGIAQKTALALAERAFGQWPAGIISPLPEEKEKKGTSVPQTGQQRRFVIYDPLFSADITQVVVQYTGLTMAQSDTAAAIFNSRTSSFKKTLLSHKELAIRGAEYINAAAAHKNGQSRLIFQSLLEKSKTPPYRQTAVFLTCVKQAADNMENTEFQQACQELAANSRSLYGSSSAVMDKLSELWAIENTDRNATGPSDLISRLLARTNEISSLDAKSLHTAYSAEDPFIFVLVNSNVYKKNADGFKNSGYEPVTQKNGSWYTQELYKNVINSRSSEASAGQKPEPADASYYISQNDPQFSSFTLSNGIPVVLKQNASSAAALVMISIKGGKISSSENPEFFTLLINALAGNIQKEINKQKQNGTIDGIPSVLAETDLTSGTISIESLATDMNVIIPCISRALIYSDIQPAQADGLIYDARSRKRLHDGDTVNQLYSRAVTELFQDTPYISLFDSGRDILEHTKYTDVLTYYPALLDASRYTIIVTGRFIQDDMHDLLEASLGILSPQTKRENTKQTVPIPQFPSDKKIKVKLRHLFLTGVNAEDAGPRPAVLVPTTNFSDPVQYWIPSPAPGSPDFPVFNALVYVLRSRLEKDALFLSTDTTVQADAASYSIQAAVITLTHIDRTQQADSLYEKTTAQLCRDAEDTTACKKLAEDMLSNWILSTLSGTQTNRGTALLIHEGIETEQSGDILQDSRQYLKDYEAVSSAAGEQIAGICSKYFNAPAPLRLYSKDSVK